MKALNEMNNVERAYLLAKLFPDTLKDLTLFIQEEIKHQRAHEEHLRRIWPKSIMTVDFWFGLIDNVERIVTDLNVSLYRSPKIFSGHLFYMHNAIFSIHCLIRYVEIKDCSKQLKQAIHLIFGEEKVIEIEVHKD